jgi:hypothetical protein
VAYTATLPEGMPNLKIDTTDARYKALEAVATREGWSQKAFSDTLGLEASRVLASARAAAPAPAPAKPDFSKMSTADKFAYALNNPRRP